MVENRQVLKLHPLIAANARHRGCARKVAVGKLINDRVFKNVLIIQHVMGKAHVFGDAAGIMDVHARTARAFLGQGCPVIIKLQGHADHVIAFLLEHGRHNGAVDAARHRHHNAGVGGGLCQAK